MLFFFSFWIWTFSLFYKAGREEQPSPVEFDCLFVENTCQFLTNRWDKKTKLATFIKHPLISFSWLPLTAKKTQISASPVSAALHQCVNSHLRCALLHFTSLRLAELMCKRGLTAAVGRLEVRCQTVDAGIHHLLGSRCGPYIH